MTGSRDIPTVGIAVRNFSLLTGVSQSLLGLVRHLPGHGFRGHIVTTRPSLKRWHERPEWAELYKETVVERRGPFSLECVPMISLSSVARAASFDFFARRRMRSAALVHGQGDLTTQDVLTVNNCDAAAAHYVPDGRRESGGVAYIRKRQFSADGSRIVIANSEMVRVHISEFYRVPPEKIKTIYHGIDLERFHPRLRAEARMELRRRLNWPEDTKIVLSVISGDANKRNVGLILRALEAMPEGSAYRFCLVGFSGWRQSDLAVKHVERGRLAVMPLTHSIETFYAAADVFVLPAFYEEFGLTVLESLATGCPAVVSHRAGSSELIVDGKNGHVLKDLRDPDALNALILKCGEITADPCRRTAEEHSWDRHLREVTALYRSLLG